MKKQYVEKLLNVKTMRDRLLLRSMVAVILMVVVACSETETLTAPATHSDYNTELSLSEQISLMDKYEIPDSMAIKLLRCFRDKLGDVSGINTRNGDEDFTIIEKMEIPLRSFVISSRSGNNDPQEKISFSKIQIKSGEKCGVAFVSNDIRSAGVIAYIPDTVSDEKKCNMDIVNTMINIGIATRLRHIEHFNSIKDSLKYAATMKIAKDGETRSSKTEDYEFIEHEYEGIELERSTDLHALTKTAWKQGYPYNCKLPQDCPNQSDGRYVAGCGVVAIAQILAHYEPDLTIYGNKVDWRLLKKNPKISASSDKKTKDMVGNLMRWIGEKAGAKYDCEDGTSTSQDAILKILNLVNMKCDAATGWNWNVIYNSIKRGNLVHAAMHSDENDGHAWVIDGYIVEKYGTETMEFIHNNFGWDSTFSGYYLYEDPVHFESGGYNWVVLDKIYPNIMKK